MNRDGILTREEFLANQPDPEKAPQRFERFDANKDGVLSPDEYATQNGAALERNGFFEREISRTTESFGHITQAFSSYESKRTAQDAKPFSRGINSIQLLNDGKRWYVVTIFWDSERPDNPIPAKYLPK